MAQALFKAWFVDFEPVRAKLGGRWQRGQSLPGLPAHFYDLFPNRLVESELGEIPEGWNISTLRSLAEVISKGTTPSKLDLATANDEPKIPFVKVRDISESGEIARGNLELIAKSIHETSLKRSIIKTDDLLFSIAGTIGRTAYVDNDLDGANLNQAIAFIRLKYKPVYFSLCWLNLRSNETQSFIASKVVQAVQANASLMNIGDIPVTVPNHEVLEKWNVLVYPMISEYRARQKENRSLVQLRDVLLPNLISGVLRVPDVKRIVGALI
jgi:type I restriction enzyme, S subunit